MKIRVERKELLENLGKVSKAVTGKYGNAILDGVNIVAGNGTLKLTGSDTNITIVSTTDNAVITEEGNIVVEPRILGEILRRLPDDVVSIETGDTMLNIKCGKSDFNIGYMAGDDYPAVEIPVDGNEIEVDESVIKNLVKSVGFAASLSDDRPILKGILMEHKDGVLYMVALDGYRLAKKSYTTEADVDFEAIIDSKNFAEASRLMISDESIHVRVSTNHAVFLMPNLTIMLRMLEGAYVKYNALIPESSPLKIRILREELVGSLERASLMGENGNKLAKLAIGANEVIVSAKSQLGQVSENISIEADGDGEMTIAFNARYMLDALKALEGEFTTLNITSPVSPCILRGDNNETGEYLVLPVRLV